MVSVLSPSDVRVELDGVEISHRLTALDVTLGVGRLPTVTLTYACFETGRLELEDVQVMHRCPLSGEFTVADEIRMTKGEE